MMLNEEPRIVLFEDVFTKQFCEGVIEASQDRFKLSGSYDDSQKQGVVDDWRTSKTFFDMSDQFIQLREFSLKIASNHYWRLKMSLGNIEKAQIHKYNVGDEYKHHCDFWNFPGNPIVHNDRVGTAIFYLNDDFEGGHTLFHRLNISVKPKQGSVLFFAYNSDFETNLLTEHSGEPVTDGTKYIATCWIRQLPL